MRREDLGKHNVHTHFPKDRNCEICKRTKITRAPCRRRKGEAVPRAENFGDLITADHKVLSDNCESRKQSSICSRGARSSHSMDPGVSVQNKNFKRNPVKLAKVPGTREETKNHLHWQFLGIQQSLWKSLLESLHVYHTDQKQMGLLREQYAEWKKVPLLYAIRSEWKLVGRFHGILFLSAKYSRYLVWWEDALWKTGWSSLICVSSSKCVYMCVKLRVHFGSILGPFWVHFGSILGPFWVHFGSI